MGHRQDAQQQAEEGVIALEKCGAAAEMRGVKVNRSLLLSSLSVLLAFGAGYAARGTGAAVPKPGDAQASPGGRGNGTASTDGEGTKRKSIAREEGKATGGRSRLFAAGQSQSWLEHYALLPGGEISRSIQFCVDCGRLDADSVEELALTCMRVAKKAEDGDPATKEKFPEPDMPAECAMIAMVRLAQLDPQRALALMKGGDDRLIPEEAMGAVAEMIAEKDPKVLQAALGDLAEKDREIAIHSLAVGLSKTDPEAALEVLGEAREGNAQIRGKCLAALAKIDLNRALNWIVEDAGKSADGSIDNQASYSALNDFLGRNQDGETRSKVLDWVANYRGADAQMVRDTALAPLLYQDLSAGIDLFNRTKAAMSAEEQASYVAQIGEHLGSWSPEQATQWLDTLPAGSVREAALRSLCEQAIRGNSAITRNNIDAVLNNPNRTAAKNPQINADYIQPSEPDWGAMPAGMETAEKWLSQIQDSAAKEELIGQFAEKLQSTNFTAALQWIDGLPDGEQKDYLRQETALKQELQRLQDSQRPPVPVLGDIPTVDRLFQPRNR